MLTAARARTVRPLHASLQAACCKPAAPFETALKPYEPALSFSSLYCSSKPAVGWWQVRLAALLNTRASHTGNLPLTVVEAYCANRHALEAVGPSLNPPTVRRLASVCTQALKTKVRGNEKWTNCICTKKRSVMGCLQMRVDECLCYSRAVFVWFHHHRLGVRNHGRHASKLP